MLLSLVSLLGLYMLGLSDRSSPGWAGGCRCGSSTSVNGISPYKYFESISRGVIDTRDIVYFACFCGFFLYANAMMLNNRRRNGVIAMSMEDNRNRVTSTPSTGSIAMRTSSRPERVGVILAGLRRTCCS